MRSLAVVNGRRGPAHRPALAGRLRTGRFPQRTGAGTTWPHVAGDGLRARGGPRRLPSRTCPGGGRAGCGYAGRAAGTLGAVRLTLFWDKMRGQFGEAYAASVAKDFVLTGLGGATVNQALAAGKEPKAVWLAVCEAFEIPEEAR
jgi:hypothetical protein